MSMRAFVWLGSLLALALWTGSADAETPSKEIQHTLAPSGTLRVGVYRGSPSSIIEGAAPQEAKALASNL